MPIVNMVQFITPITVRENKLFLKVIFNKDFGPEFYKACLAFHTSTNLTAEEIHQKGLDEVERIEEEMREIVNEMGYNVTLPEFIEILRYGLKVNPV